MHNINIYSLLRKLAKSTYAQNLFIASKELNIDLFRNKTDLSKIQQMYLSYLYFYDVIERDMTLKNISKHILDKELYEDCYMLWKKEKSYKEQEKDNKQQNLKLINSKKIVFPKRD